MKKSKIKTQDDLNELQQERVDTVMMATAGCERSPEIRIGIDAEDDETVAGIMVDAGDDDITIVFKTGTIEIGVASDAKEKEGYYKINNAAEHLFIADLINAIWTNKYEELFDRMFSCQVDKGAE